jgi:hypothetical protein
MLTQRKCLTLQAACLRRQTCAPLLHVGKQIRQLLALVEVTLHEQALMPRCVCTHEVEECRRPVMVV